MSIFGDIVNAIFTKAAAAGSAIATAATAATSAVTGSSTGTAATAGTGKAAPMTREQVEEMIQQIADDTGRSEYNWDTSIVDLMKLLDLDSSLKARQQLARELGYTGATDGSAAMNTWLHEQVMTKVMEGKDIVQS